MYDAHDFLELIGNKFCDGSRTGRCGNCEIHMCSSSRFKIALAMFVSPIDGIPEVFSRFERTA